MKRLARGTSRIWAFLFRAKLARPHMPFWRVVVEAKLDRRARKWPRRHDAVVTAVFVWAQTIEEAEALGALALEPEGLIPLTADAAKCAPSAPPRREAGAVARTELRYLPRLEQEPGVGGTPRRDARA